MSAGWDAVAAAADDAVRMIEAEAPDAATLAEGRGYVSRVTAAAVADATLGHLWAADGLARALPVKGGPNPDYIIASSRIDPARTYRLSGRLNGSERIGVGLYALAAGAPPVEVGYAVIGRDTADEAGRFALVLSPDGTNAGTLRIGAECRLLITRTLHRAPGEPAAQLVLEGGEAACAALPSGDDEERLSRAAQAVRSGVTTYLAWTRSVAARPNRIGPPVPELGSGVQGDRETEYFLGSFDLGPGEWLEMTMPALLPGYWSVHAYNHWFESLQVAGVDDRNAVADPDGRTRVRIGPQVPSGLANPLLTAGRSRGAIICRIIRPVAEGPPQATKRLRP